MQVATMRIVDDDARPTIFEATISRFARRNSGALTDLAIFNPLFPSMLPRIFIGLVVPPLREINRSEVTDFFPHFRGGIRFKKRFSPIRNLNLINL